MTARNRRLGATHPVKLHFCIAKSLLGFRHKLKIVLERRDAARPTSSHLEEQLYAGGFARAEDFFEGLRMHRMDPKYRHFQIDRLSDPRLRTHAFRMIHAIAPETLPSDIRVGLDKWLRERLTIAGDVPWMTIQKALDNTETLRRDITDEADRLACVLFPDPHPTERCPDTGAWIEDLAAVEDIECSRAAFIEAHAGHDLVLLDDYEIWLKAKLEVIPRGYVRKLVKKKLALRVPEYEAIIWSIDTSIDSFIHLQDIMEAMEGIEFWVSRPIAFGKPADFESFNTSVIGKKFIAEGRVIDLPKMPDAAFNALKCTERQTPLAYMSSGSVFEKTTIEMWRGKLEKAFKPLFERYFTDDQN